MTITEKAKALIGQNVRILNRVSNTTYWFPQSGTVETVKGVNGSTAKVIFASGVVAYIDHYTKVESL